MNFAYNSSIFWNSHRDRKLNTIFLRLTKDQLVLDKKIWRLLAWMRTWSHPICIHSERWEKNRKQGRPWCVRTMQRWYWAHATRMRSCEMRTGKQDRQLASRQPLIPTTSIYLRSMTTVDRCIISILGEARSISPHIIAYVYFWGNFFLDSFFLLSQMDVRKYIFQKK